MGEILEKLKLCVSTHQSLALEEKKKQQNSIYLTES